MRCKFTFGLVVVAQLAFFGPIHPAPCAEAVSNDRRLPPGVVAYVTVSSIDQFKERWSDSLMGQLQQDKNVSAFISDIVTQFGPQIDELSKNVQRGLGVSLEELASVPSGEISFVAAQSAGQKTWFAAFLDFGKSDEVVQTLLDKVADALVSRGARRTSQSVEGTQVTVFTFPAPADNPNAAEHSAAYFVKDSVLVVASDASAPREILARWDGNHPKTFADDAVYQYIRSRCKEGDSEPLVSYFIDPIGIVKAVASSIQSPNAMTFQVMMMSFLPTLGVDKLKAIGGSYDIATGPYNSISRTLIYVEPPATGALELFHCTAVEQTPPKWVTDRMAGYSTVNWDIAAAYGAAEKLYEMFQQPGAFAQMIDQLAEQGEGPHLHLKRDFVDQLTGKIHVATQMSDDKSSVSQGVLVALELNDSGSMKETLSKIAQTPSFPAKTRMFRGETLIEFPMPSNFETGNQKAALAVTNGHLMFSNDVTLLEQVIRADSDQKPLADSTDYRRIAEHVPARTCILGFQKQDTVIEQVYDMLRSGDFPNADQLPIDFTKLPEFEVLRKYLPAAGSYAEPDRNGVLFVNFTLNNAGR